MEGLGEDVQSDISIHAPLAGCDVPGPQKGAAPIISIHAPLAGCDASRSPLSFETLDFNPRTPCGVRPSSLSAHKFRRSYFNPRTPCGVRRASFSNQLVRVTISIHAPLAGCDVISAAQSAINWLFQSTHPLRGATRDVLQLRIAILFQSTHPLRGATLYFPIDQPCFSYFNPRTPCGVRHDAGQHQVYDDQISIHAPLAGCDPCSC